MASHIKKKRVHRLRNEEEAGVLSEIAFWAIGVPREFVSPEDCLKIIATLAEVRAEEIAAGGR